MRLMIAVAILMGLGSVTLAAEKNCVNTRILRGHKVVDSSTLVFEAGRTDYVFTTRGCNLNSAERLGFRLNSSFICRGDSITLLDYDNRFVGSCRIAKIEAQ